MKKSILRECIARCYRDLDKHPQRSCFPHWSFLIVDNKIVSAGVNRQHEPARCFGYHQQAKDINSKTFRPKWHSETDLVYRSKFSLRDATVVNVRLGKDGSVRLSMPCETCRNILYVVGVSKVYFTSEHGWGTLTF